MRKLFNLTYLTGCHNTSELDTFQRTRSLIHHSIEKPSRSVLFLSRLCLEISWPPTTQGERSLSYKICPLLTYSICYWEVCIHFSERGRIFCLGDFPQRGFFMGRKFQWAEFFRGTITLGEFAWIPTKYFVCLAFSLMTQFYVRICQGQLSGVNFCLDFNYLENISVGRRDFFVKVEPGFLVLFRKTIRN